MDVTDFSIYYDLETNEVRLTPHYHQFETNDII